MLGTSLLVVGLLIILPGCSEALGENFGGRRSSRRAPNEQGQPPPPRSSGQRSSSFGVPDLPALGDVGEDSVSNLSAAHSPDTDMYRQYSQPPFYALPPQGQHYHQQQQGYFLPPSAESDYYYGTLGRETAASFLPDSYSAYSSGLQQPYALPPGYALPSSMMTYEGVMAANTAGMDSMLLAGSSSTAQLDTTDVREGRGGRGRGRGSRGRRRSRDGSGEETGGEGSSSGVINNVAEGSSSGAAATARTRRRGRAASSGILPHINTGRGNNDDEDDGGDQSDRQLQTARVRQSRTAAIAEILGMPSTARPALSAEQEKLRIRKWMTQEWERQGLNFGMAAQDLALAVARMKITHPGIAKSIGKTCWDRVQKGKRMDMWYLYDYHTWSDAYQGRIMHLENVYEAEGISDERQIRQLLLDNFWITSAKHYATLADPEAEAAEVAIAQEIGDEFFTFATTQIQQHTTPDQILTIENVAEHSWNWHTVGYTHPVTMKYLFKYLRCINGWTPDQIDLLKSLQDAEREKAAPTGKQATRGRGRGRARRDPGVSS